MGKIKMALLAAAKGTGIVTGVAGTGYGAYNTLVNDDSCYGVLTCASDKPFHPVEKGKDPVPLKTMYVENHGWYALNNNRYPKILRQTPFYKAWLEYNDAGNPFSADQKNAILDKLTEFKKQNKPVSVVVYVHGWHHNADDSVPADEKGFSAHDAVKFDYFMARQADQLRRLYEQRGSKDTPAVLGIFVGWRGDSLTTYGMEQLTIGNRADAADRLGGHRHKNSLHTTLKDISTFIRDANPDNRMMVVGHSLGGRVVSRLTLDALENGVREPFGAGTLAVALEPAIGADCFDKALAKKKAGQPGAPGLIAITSKADISLTKYYPMGSSAYLIEDCDDDSDASGGVIGLHEDYLTHSLSFKAGTKITTIESSDKLKTSQPNAAFPPAGMTSWPETFGQSTLAYNMYFMKCGENTPSPRCYDRSDAPVYQMSFTAEAAFSKAAMVWNIRTDENTINFQGKHAEDKTDATHNGYISTNLARLLTEWLYRDLPRQITPAPAPK